jgi:hypothetical protein
MPIEDIDYMKENSIKQSYIFQIDSADRDYFQFPTPSVYTVTFDQPFTTVFGLEVIDANIPNSAFNIDGGNLLYPTNNTIAFYIHSSNIDISKVDPASYTIASITPGNYTIQTLVAAINATGTNPLVSPLLQMHVNNNSNMPLATISVQTQTNPPEVTNTLVLTCPYPFVIDTSQSTISETLGFDLLTSANGDENMRSPLLQRFTTFAPQITNPNYKYQSYSMYHSVDLPSTIGLGNANMTYIGPTGIITNLPLGTSNYIAQSFVVPYNCYLTGVGAALGNSTGVAKGIAYWSLYTNNSNDATDLIPGKPGTLIQLTNVESNNKGLFEVDYIDGGYTPTTSTSELVNPTFAYLEPGIYWVVINAPDESNNTLYYNDVPLSSGYALNRIMLISNDAGNTYYENPDDNIPLGLQYIASLQITIQEEYHKLTAPGIYSLLGQRFMVLRCKEIEDSSLRSLAYTKHSLGLAKFTMGVVGVSQNRLDFSSVPLREFFPIGKLIKLSFRYETLNGLLYDFKGVNHTITFAIHYYEATSKKIFKGGLLNPNYTGNFLNDIQYGCGGDEGEQDSDDQEFDYNRDNYEQMINLREHRHLPSNIRIMDNEALKRFQLSPDDYEALNNTKIIDESYQENDDENSENSEENNDLIPPPSMYWNT